MVQQVFFKKGCSENSLLSYRLLKCRIQYIYIYIIKISYSRSSAVSLTAVTSSLVPFSSTSSSSSLFTAHFCVVCDDDDGKNGQQKHVTLHLFGNFWKLLKFRFHKLESVARGEPSNLMRVTTLPNNNQNGGGVKMQRATSELMVQSCKTWKSWIALPYHTIPYIYRLKSRMDSSCSEKTKCVDKKKRRL
jgi:hypothetical protein